MKRIAIILIACVLCFVSFVSCDNNDTRMPTELVFEYGFPSEIEMYEGERLIDNYIMYKGIVDFKNNNAVFFSSDENVVRVEVSTQEFPIYTYFNIVAVSEGNAIIFAQSADGSVTSEPIKITVRKNINSSDDINSNESLNTEELIQNYIYSNI